VVAIRYRTAGDHPVQVMAADGHMTTLPPALDGHTAILDLEAMNATEEIAFFTEDPTGATIESIRLVEW
jgi:hypothetical protein